MTFICCLEAAVAWWKSFILPALCPSEGPAGCLDFSQGYYRNAQRENRKGWLRLIDSHKIFECFADLIKVKELKKQILYVHRWIDWH